MFTGLIKGAAALKLLEKKEKSTTLALELSSEVTRSWELGASIALNGVCLTVSDFKCLEAGAEKLPCFELSAETLECSNLKYFYERALKVHWESALSLGDKLGGHYVTGHVDCTAPISKFEGNSEGLFMSVELEGASLKKVAPFVVTKGSITVNGVSLTLNKVSDFPEKSLLEFYLIPHTLKLTHFLSLSEQMPVNLEVDVLAKHMLRGQKWSERSL